MIYNNYSVGAKYMKFIDPETKKKIENIKKNLDVLDQNKEALEAVKNGLHALDILEGKDYESFSQVETDTLKENCGNLSLKIPTVWRLYKNCNGAKMDKAVFDDKSIQIKIVRIKKSTKEILAIVAPEENTSLPEPMFEDAELEAKTYDQASELLSNVAGFRSQHERNLEDFEVSELESAVKGTMSVFYNYQLGKQTKKQFMQFQLSMKALEEVFYPLFEKYEASTNQVLVLTSQTEVATNGAQETSDLLDLIDKKYPELSEADKVTLAENMKVMRKKCSQLVSDVSAYLESVPRGQKTEEEKKLRADKNVLLYQLNGYATLSTLERNFEGLNTLFTQIKDIRAGKNETVETQTEAVKIETKDPNETDKVKNEEKKKNTKSSGKLTVQEIQTRLDENVRNKYFNTLNDEQWGHKRAEIVDELQQLDCTIVEVRNLLKTAEQKAAYEKLLNTVQPTKSHFLKGEATFDAVKSNHQKLKDFKPASSSSNSDQVELNPVVDETTATEQTLLVQINNTSSPHKEEMLKIYERIFSKAQNYLRGEKKGINPEVTPKVLEMRSIRRFLSRSLGSHADLPEAKTMLYKFQTSLVNAKITEAYLVDLQVVSLAETLYVKTQEDVEKLIAEGQALLKKSAAKKLKSKKGDGKDNETNDSNNEALEKSVDPVKPVDPQTPAASVEVNQASSATPSQLKEALTKLLTELGLSPIRVRSYLTCAEKGKFEKLESVFAGNGEAVSKFLIELFKQALSELAWSKYDAVVMFLSLVGFDDNEDYLIDGILDYDEKRDYDSLDRDLRTEGVDENLVKLLITVLQTL